ncbi:MAG: hypothetical protein V4583_09140 [Pseudomonadota bacterium]
MPWIINPVRFATRPIPGSEDRLVAVTRPGALDLTRAPAHHSG